jgi:hypothetical protein
MGTGGELGLGHREPSTREGKPLNGPRPQNVPPGRGTSLGR